MVRAILDGRKTQTRRVMKPQPFVDQEAPWRRPMFHKPSGKFSIPSSVCHDTLIQCPYGKTGDSLWVRETWGPCDGGFCYASVEGDRWRDVKPDGGKWKPSIHMPRWASRITLEVAAVRAERLQDITEDDAKSEGIEAIQPLPSIRGAARVRAFRDYQHGVGFHQARQSFHSLWDSINSSRGLGWEKNPWVWVIEFRKL